MKISGIVLLCCAILVSGQSSTDDPVIPTTASTTTTPEPEPTTTTKAPTTTTPPQTTTPSPPTTTTPKPTPAPPAPPAPTPTPAPVQPYPHNVGKWTVVDPKTNVSCIALKAAMQIVVTNHNDTYTLNIPSNPQTSADGSCSAPESVVLTWNSDVLTEDKTDFEKNRLTLHFRANRSSSNLQAADTGITVGKYGVQNLTAVLYLNQSASAGPVINPFNVDLTFIDILQTPLNHSYLCLAEEEVKSTNGTFVLKIREVQMEAYRADASGHNEFSASVQCPADDATDVVPIAVGAALAGLVVIVLIAYLIGRRRSRARGYQSV